MKQKVVMQRDEMAGFISNPTGVAKTDAEMDALSLHRNEFRGDWNYELRPR